MKLANTSIEEIAKEAKFELWQVKASSFAMFDERSKRVGVEGINQVISQV